LKRSKTAWKTVVLFLLLLLVSAASLMIGPVKVQPAALAAMIASFRDSGVGLQNTVASAVREVSAEENTDNPQLDADLKGGRLSFEKKNSFFDRFEKKLGIRFSTDERVQLNSIDSISAAAVGKLDLLSRILWEIRFPRLCLAMTTGASLAAAGAVFQGLLRNPLADPYILGISSGAGFGAAAGIVLGFRLLFRPFFSFCGAVAAFFAVYAIGSERGRLPRDRLLLAGVVTGAFLGSLIMLLMTMAVSDLGQIVHILMGSLAFPFTDQSWRLFLVCSVLLAGSLVFLIAHGRELDALALGDESASHVGIETEGVKKRLFVVTSLVVGIAVSFAGLIGFVGLIVPHAVRLLFGPAHTRLILVSAVAGAVFLSAADLLARSVLQAELPVGVVTAMTGAPFFLYLLATRRRFF